MARLKQWIAENFLPRYAQEMLLEENRRLKQALQEARQQYDCLSHYVAGLEYALRHMPGVVVNNHENTNSNS